MVSILHIIFYIAIVYLNYRHINAYRSPKRVITFLPCVALLIILYIICFIVYPNNYVTLIILSLPIPMALTACYVRHKGEDERRYILCLLFTMSLPVCFVNLGNELGWIVFFVFLSSIITSYLCVYRYPVKDGRFNVGTKYAKNRMSWMLIHLSYNPIPAIASNSMFFALSVGGGGAKTPLYSNFILLYSVIMYMYMIQNYLLVLSHLGFISDKQQ